jgi:CheY-like chemotaxis protein
MNKNAILAIESDSVSLKIIKEALEGAGYTVVTATSAQEGLSRAREIIPALILLNLATPGSNGLEICKTIHTDSSLRDIPIILLTLKEGKFDPIYTKLYGIVTFIKKPFTNEELVGPIREHAPVVEAPAETSGDMAMEVSDEELASVEDVQDESSEEADEDAYVLSFNDTDVSLEEAQEAITHSIEHGEDEEGPQAVPEAIDEPIADTEGPGEFDVDSLEESENGEEDAGGPAEFSVDSFAESLKHFEEEEEGGGPQEFSEDSFQESVSSPLSPEPEETPDSLAKDLEQMGRNVDASFEEPGFVEGITDESFNTPGGSDGMSFESLGTLEETTTDFKEEAPVIEDLEFEPVIKEPPEKKKKMKKKKGKKALKGPGCFKKAVLTLFLLAVFGGGGFAAYTFYLQEKFGLPKIDIEVPEAVTEVVAEVPAKIKGLVEKVYPGKPEEETAKAPPPLPAIVEKAKSEPPAGPETPPPPPQVKKPVEKAAEAKTVKAEPEAPKPVAEKPSGPGYYVQFGAFRNAKNAERLAKNLKSKGLNVFIRKKDPRISLVLLEEKFSSLKSATTRAREIKRTKGVDTAPIRL